MLWCQFIGPWISLSGYFLPAVLVTCICVTSTLWLASLCSQHPLVSPVLCVSLGDMKSWGTYCTTSLRMEQVSLLFTKSLPCFKIRQGYFSRKKMLLTTKIYLLPPYYLPHIFTHFSNNTSTLECLISVPNPLEFKKCYCSNTYVLLTTWA